jgi:hypothetical protein
MKPENAPGPSGSASKIPPNAQVEGTLTGEAGLRCQLAHRPQRYGFAKHMKGRGAIRGLSRFTDALRTGHRQVTVRADSSVMRRAVVTAAVVLAAGLAQVAGAGTRGGGNPPPFPRLAGGWSHAEINVVIAKQPHTLILDQGRVIAVTASQLTLLETGNPTAVAIPLAPTTRIMIGGRAAQWSELRRRMTAATMRIDGGAAVRVRATHL